MLGAIIGDIVGSVYEFNNIRTKEFPLFSKNSRATDDSIMSLAVLDILQNNNINDKDKIIDTLKSWGRTYPDRGYGGRFRRWLFSDDREAYNSFGNGSAMRISAVAWYANNSDEIIDYAKKVTEVTHNHHAGIRGAIVTAMCIYYARTGKTKEQIKEYVEKYYNINFDYEELRKHYGFYETCPESVPQAIYCFLISNSFEDCIRTTISIGGDCDTTTAISCAIAEAYYKDEFDDNYWLDKIKNRLPEAINGHDALELLENYLKRKKEIRDVEKKISEEADKGLDFCQKGELKRGIKHLLIAAEKNDINAITNLGHAYKLVGDYKEAFKWTLKAAELGQKVAMSNLAIMYKCGQGVECNAEEAAKWGKKLVELGEIDDGYNTIVMAYSYVKDEKQQDFNKAFEYALEGSKKIMEKKPNPEKGDPCETVMQLALCYEFGRGTKNNQKKSIEYYEYCSKCGLGIASYNLACVYAYPEDETLFDIKKALDYYYEAIEAGYTDAYYQLGYLHQQGEKVQKDLDLAKFFYANAIRLGNGKQHYEDAIENLKEISEEDALRVQSGKYSFLID